MVVTLTCRGTGVMDNQGRKRQLYFRSKAKEKEKKERSLLL
jgi:hypothetical protein